MSRGVTKIHQLNTAPVPVVMNRYKTALDPRGATSRPAGAPPVGKDPLAVEEGKADTTAQMEYLAAQRPPL